MTATWPKLVRGWDEKHPADRAICTRCEAEFTVDPGEGDPYDLCTKHADCGGQIVMKYDAGEECRNCRKLDYSMPDGLKGCCSRKCLLQAEYAASLKADS